MPFLLPVYINAVGTCLPGEPVGNDAMEAYIGKINGKASRLGKLALRQNKIQQRYYALRPDGTTDWSHARLLAAASREALKRSELLPQDIGFLATASSQADFLVPGNASMVHGELPELGTVEVASFQSVCASSMMALKMAMLQLQTGEHTSALVAAGEFASRYFRPGNYENTALLNEKGELPLSAEFLRWTLSDGAGALVLENKPNERGLSLKMEWMHQRSFAHQFWPCMVAGSNLDPMTGWGSLGNPMQAHQRGDFALRQDFRILAEMMPVWVAEYVQLLEAARVSLDSMDYFLCHYSSHSLKLELQRLLDMAGASIPEEKWFNNLAEVGNTGSASLFIMLDALLSKTNLQSGQQLFCVVPESGRAAVAFMLLRVV